jgi:hypothetical protein
LDTEHAVHLADCDLLLTGDKAFFKVLSLLAQEGVPVAQLGRPVLVRQRPDRSALEAIRTAIEEAGSA